jgi:chemotaxis protein MotB
MSMTTLSARTGKMIVLSGLIILLAGCSGMEKLKTENASLKTQVSELQQVKKDYSDKLTSAKLNSEQEQASFKNELEQLRAELKEKLQEQISENQVLLQKVEGLTIITLGEESLFGSGLADLTQSGAQTISTIAEALTDYPGYHMRIEGHTDSKPVSKSLKAKFASNWELSTARATAVVRYMIYGLHVDPLRLSAAGYAQYRPMVDNSTKEGRAANRRIRAVIFREAQ